MGIVKENSGCGQTVQVWRLGLRMSAQATDPVVQVIHRNEQNVWFSAPTYDGRDKEYPKQGKNRLLTKQVPSPYGRNLSENSSYPP